ncbi:MAG TPA: prolipoprotein diacylglyceryl transferase [Thermoanaerobaculia bacterium]|nr:prolipoprotein diacylglyceryl transferase [Thermoanaerobaculia bacterium]
MWPTLVKFGNFEITTFGVMMFLAFIFAGMVLTRQYRRYGLSDDLASSIVFGAALGGILGAKIYFAILYHDFHALFSRAGLVWYGGFIGGVAVCSFIILRNKVPYLLAMDGGAPALALGYAIGRIGCFLVGDDYGRPTDSAIGMAFPKGLPPTTAQSLRKFGVKVDPSLAGDTLLRVHPTQLYESASAFLIFGILMFMARKPHHRGRIFAMFLVLAGIERFLVEIVRAKDDRLLGPFTVAQLISVIMIIVGASLFAYASRTPVENGLLTPAD